MYNTDLYPKDFSYTVDVDYNNNNYYNYDERINVIQ